MAEVARIAPDNLPEYVQWWFRSLMDDDLVDMLRAAGDRPIEVRLYANKGKVRRRPTLLIGVGQVDEISPESP